MTSARKVRANRANARRSTGPKTAAGRAKTAQNARRHGLRIPVLSDPALSVEAEVLAQTILGDASSSPELLELARKIAEAEIDVIRVRRARSELVSSELSDFNYRHKARRVFRSSYRALMKNKPESPSPEEPEGKEGTRDVQASSRPQKQAGDGGEHGHKGGRYVGWRGLGGMGEQDLDMILIRKSSRGQTCSRLVHLLHSELLRPSFRCYH